jgi:hypothetical protein
VGRSCWPPPIALCARGRARHTDSSPVWPRERLPHTTRAIACVRALARATMVAVDAKTAYRLEAARHSQLDEADNLYGTQLQVWIDIQREMRAY